MADATCLTCRYFRAKENGIGLCVRYPPTVVGKPKAVDDYPDIAACTFWPALEQTNVCGEWQPEGGK